MSVTPSSTVVGVFRDQTASEKAVNALYDAGFGQEQIRYAVPGTSGSFFDDLKSFFTGTGDNEGKLANDLTNMGLSDAEAQYYSSEYNNGNNILVVRAAGREAEALLILRQYGAYNTEAASDSSSETPSATQQPGDDAQQDAYATSGQYSTGESWGIPSQPQTVEEYPFAEPQPDTMTPQYDEDDQDTQPGRPVIESAPQDSQADVASPEYDAGNQALEADEVISEPGSVMAASETIMTSPYEEEDYQVAQASVASPEETDELQQLQAQIQTLQQQLEEAKTRLQAAKEQESQLKTARERQQQLQSARQQMQDLQAELQATQEELQEVQSRIAQYQ